MLTFSMLFNLVIAGGIIGVLVYTVYSIVKKQVPSVPMIAALSFVLYELIVMQNLLPYIGLSVAAEYGYFSREAIIVGLPFIIGILLISYSLFLTVALGKKAPICSRLNFSKSLVAIAILIALSHPIIGVITAGAVITGVLLFGATVVGYLANVVLSLIFYFYKNASRRHDIACGNGEVCLSPFPLLPLVDISSFAVISRSFIFGAAALMPVAFWILHCGPIMLNVLIFFAVFASAIMIIKYDREDGAFHISIVLGIVALFFGLLTIGFLTIGVSDDSIPDEKKLISYGMIATGLLLFISGTIKSAIVVESSCDATPSSVRHQATTVAHVKPECVVSADPIKACRVKKKYPSGR